MSNRWIESFVWGGIGTTTTSANCEYNDCEFIGTKELDDCPEGVCCCYYYDYSIAVCNQSEGDPYYGAVHPGTDIPLTYGTELFAVVSGNVTYYPHVNLQYPPLCAVISDDAGRDHIYGHLSGYADGTDSPAGNPNYVNKGERIGYSGDAGSGPHLHYEVRDQSGYGWGAAGTIGISIDPWPFLEDSSGQGNDGAGDNWNGGADEAFDIGYYVQTIDSNVNLRSAALVGNNIIATLPYGVEGTILNGPVVNGGTTWWRWQTGYGTGWSAEQYLGYSGTSRSRAVFQQTAVSPDILVNGDSDPDAGFIFPLTKGADYPIIQFGVQSNDDNEDTCVRVTLTAPGYRQGVEYRSGYLGVPGGGTFTGSFFAIGVSGFTTLNGCYIGVKYTDGTFQSIKPMTTTELVNNEWAEIDFERQFTVAGKTIDYAYAIISHSGSANQSFYVDDVTLNYSKPA